MIYFNFFGFSSILFEAQYYRYICYERSLRQVNDKKFLSTVIEIALESNDSSTRRCTVVLTSEPKILRTSFFGSAIILVRNYISVNQVYWKSESSNNELLSCFHALSKRDDISSLSSVGVPVPTLNEKNCLIISFGFIMRMFLFFQVCLIIFVLHTSTLAQNCYVSYFLILLWYRAYCRTFEFLQVQGDKKRGK